MFVLSRNVSASFRVIATLVATAVVMWTLGVSHFAQAANIKEVYDLLSDSAPGASANHTIQFATPTGVANGSTIVITFPAEFNINGVASDDIDIATTTNYSVGADCLAAEDVGASFAGQILTLTFCSGDGGYLPANATSTIEIGTHATTGSTGNTQIVNPTDPDFGNESYEIDISAGADSGSTRVVILDTVEVTANVLTTFDFTVLPNGVGEDVNGETTTIGSSSTTIPFGTLTAGDPEVISQDLTVQTNAIHGFVVTVEQDQHLLSSTGADIDNFANNNNSVVPAVWGALAPNVSNENTWGHWGVTTEDSDTTRAAEFGVNEWLGVSTTASVIFSHTGPADETTPGIGSTTVGYKVEITALQEAADDYSTTLTYIATPTF